MTERVLQSEAPIGRLPGSKQPDFFIVGAPKCGTTAMAQYLSEHPDIFMARKEMHFFGSDLRFSRRFYRRGRTDYLAEFAGWSGQRRAAEASVWYLFSSQAAAELKTFNPDARVLIMLREPSEMLYSLYHQFSWDGNEHLGSFAEALAAEKDRCRGHRITRRTYLAQALAYRETACYTKQVERYFHAFGRERVKVVIYDDFVASAADAYRDVLEFLEVDTRFAPARFKVINPAKSVKSSALRSILSEPWLRAAGIELALRLPKPAFNLLQNLDANLRGRNTRFETPPPIDPELQTQIKQEFAPEIARLSELLGRDLTHWSRPQSSAFCRSGETASLPNQNHLAQRAGTVEATALL